MKITKTLLEELIVNEIKDLKDLNSRYDKLIENQNSIIDSLLNEALDPKTSNALVTGNLDDIRNALKQLNAATMKRTNDTYKANPQLVNDTKAKALISRANTEAQIALQSLIGKFLKQAKDSQIQNPEGYAAILMDEIIRGAANIVSREQTPVNINTIAKEFEKQLDSANKPPTLPADADKTTDSDVMNATTKYINKVFNRANEVLKNIKQSMPQLTKNLTLNIKDVDTVIKYLMKTDKYKLVEQQQSYYTKEKVVPRNSEFGKLVNQIVNDTKLKQPIVLSILNALITLKAFGAKKIDTGSAKTTPILEPLSDLPNLNDIKEHLKKRNNYQLLKSQLTN